MVDFDRHFSVRELKKKSDNERIRIMNKIIEGKFLPKDFNIKKAKLKQNFIIQYIYNQCEKEDIPFVLDIIKKTKSYNNDYKTRDLVNKNFNIKGPKNPKNFIESTLDGIDNADMKPIYTIYNDIKNGRKYEGYIKRVTITNLEKFIDKLPENSRIKLKDNLLKEGIKEKLDEISKNSGVELGTLLLVFSNKKRVMEM